MDELITKRAAIDAVNDVLAEYIPTFRTWQNGIPLGCALKIKALPPVYVPDTNVGDMISRQAALDAIHCNITVTGRQNAELVAATIGAFADRIKALPAVQPERMKGAWINEGRITRCNKCKIGYATVKGMKSALTYNFCPNCGADMRCKAE